MLALLFSPPLLRRRPLLQLGHTLLFLLHLPGSRLPAAGSLRTGTLGQTLELRPESFHPQRYRR